MRTIVIYFNLQISGACGIPASCHAACAARDISEARKRRERRVAMAGTRVAHVVFAGFKNGTPG